MLNFPLPNGRVCVADTFISEDSQYFEFTAVSDYELTETEARYIQEKLAFPCKENGFEAFESTLAMSKWITKWKCRSEGYTDAVKLPPKVPPRRE